MLNEEKNLLTIFCTSDIRDFSTEAPMLLGWDSLQRLYYEYIIITQDEGRFVDA
jgi:hypothetical protein